VKLLLDEMFPSELSSQLRAHGHDVVAVAERPDLRSQSDARLFAAAQLERRTLLTENSSDFRILAVRAMMEEGSHCGLIYTTHRQFPRNVQGALGKLVRALHDIMSDNADFPNREVWLR
jgi:predicted nuclease of predicted toxin-antitoxin system